MWPLRGQWSYYILLNPVYSVYSSKQLNDGDCPKDIFNIMLKCYDRCSMKGCSLDPDPNVTEARTDVGLIRGHAYSITKVRFDKWVKLLLINSIC